VFPAAAPEEAKPVNGSDGTGGNKSNRTECEEHPRSGDDSDHRCASESKETHQDA
jgi:hypothetical protein